MVEEEEEEYLYIPTTAQQKIVSVLVIIPSLLSFIGSSLIIYHVIHDRKKTPCEWKQTLLSINIFVHQISHDPIPDTRPKTITGLVNLRFHYNFCMDHSTISYEIR